MWGCWVFRLDFLEVWLWCRIFFDSYCQGGVVMIMIDIYCYLVIFVSWVLVELYWWLEFEFYDYYMGSDLKE